MMKVVALCGQAGSGKDYILTQLVEGNPDQFHRIVSHTTRDKREGEVEGLDYFFVSDREMFDMFYNKEMLEGDFFFNEAYGTSEKSLSKEKINIGTFSPDGVFNLKYDSRVVLLPIYVDVSEHKRFERMMRRSPDKPVKKLFERHQNDLSDFKDVENMKERIKFNNEKDTIVKKDLEKLKLSIESHFSEKI